MIPQTQVNGADRASFLEVMANGSEYYREVLTGIRDDVRGVQTEVAGLRSNVNQLSNQMTRIEAFDLHGRLERAVVRVEILEKDKATYDGQIRMLKWISSITTFISVLVGLIMLMRGLK